MCTCPHLVADVHVLTRDEPLERMRFLIPNLLGCSNTAAASFALDQDMLDVRAGVRIYCNDYMRIHACYWQMKAMTVPFILCKIVDYLHDSTSAAASQ